MHFAGALHRRISIIFVIFVSLTLSESRPSCSCGIRKQAYDGSRAGRIVGGGDAGKAEFPWRCYLFVPGALTCGCTIIHPNWVLTSAHCAPTARSGSFLVDAGDHDISMTSDTKPQFRSSDTSYVHPEYNATSFDNDIALIYVDKAFQFNKNVSAACLPWHLRNHDLAGSKVVATGWGSKKQHGKPSVILQKVSLPIIRNDTCSEMYPGAISANMLCTYDYGFGVCQGDSGSSIDYKESKTGRYHTVGIMSFAKGCGDYRFPGVYTKVTNYLDWIERITGNIFCKDY